MRITFTILALCGLVHVIFALTPAQQLMKKVNKKDRGLFTVYHLALALNKYGRKNESIALPWQAKIPLDKYRYFKTLAAPYHFDKNLLKWVQTDLQMTTPLVYELVTTSSLVCVTSDVCFDPDDIGVACCPF